MSESVVRVELSPVSSDGSVLLRLPGYGGDDRDGKGPPGHLLLTLQRASEASVEAKFTPSVLSREEERAMLAKRSVTVAVLLILTFLGLLRLSGWM